MAAKQRTVKTSVVSTSPAGNKRTHGTIGGAQHPVIAEERAPKRSADARQLAPLQVRSSKFPGGMGEERRAAYVTNKIDKEEATHCLPKSTVVLTSPIPPSLRTPPIPSPEPSVVPMPLIPVSPPVLHRLFDESTSAVETVAEQRANDIVSKDKTNVSEHSPEDSMPIPLSAHQAQTMPPCQDQDKASLPVEVTPTRSSLRDIKVKKSKPSREDEGLYLSRVATYIHERMDRRSSASDTFIPRARKDPPDKPVETDARQIGQDIVSVNTTSVALHSPDNLATFELLIPESEPSPPSTSVSPASPNNDLISKEDQLIVMQTRYNNETYKVEIETHECRRVLDDVNGGNEASGTRLHKVKNEDVKPLHSYAGPVTHQPAPMDTSPPIVKTQGGEDELLEAAEVHCPKDWELARRVPEHSEPHDTAINLCQWPSQEPISNEDLSVFLHSLEPTAALMLPMPAATQVSPPPARLLLWPRMELESQRRKPPDQEEGSRRLPYIVSERLQTSVIKHSPSHGTVLMLPNIPSTHQGWAETHCLPNVELAWRACSKPPDTLDEIGQRSADVISANTCTRATHSPLYGTALMLPVFPLASSAQVTSPCRRNNELVPRVRKLPDAIGCWLQTEAVNKTEEGWKRGHLPVLRPTFHPLARLPLRWSVLTSLTDRYVCEMSVVWHANGKGCF